MCRNRNGQVRADAEALFEQIKGNLDEEIAALNERKAVLRDALNSFKARLDDLPERERNAVLSRLYQRITETVFDFHLSVATRVARANIVAAPNGAGKLQAFREFKGIVDDLALLYGIPA